MAVTTMQCRKITLDFLKSIGKYGESYEKIIYRIADEAGYKKELEKAGIKLK